MKNLRKTEFYDDVSERDSCVYIAPMLVTAVTELVLQIRRPFSLSGIGSLSLEAKAITYYPRTSCNPPLKHLALNPLRLTTNFK